MYAKYCHCCPIFTYTSESEEKPKIVVFRPVKSDRFLVNDKGQLRVEKVDFQTDKNCHFSEHLTVENYAKKYEFRSESNDKLYLGVTDQKTFGLTEKNPGSNTYFKQLECSGQASIDTEGTCNMDPSNKRTCGETDESFISTNSCNLAVQLFLKPWGTGTILYIIYTTIFVIFDNYEYFYVMCAKVFLP